jgi:hypothetical protein
MGWFNPEKRREAVRIANWTVAPQGLIMFARTSACI